MGNKESMDYSSPDRHFQQPEFQVGSSMDPGCQSRPQAPYIADNFSSLDEVITALREAGLESSNLILGIDFTKSNEWTGKYSFNRRSLHAIGNPSNPYEQAISIIGQTLSPFDEDNLIPCFGFGDASTHDQHVFSFYQDHRYCNGFEEVLARYREIVPHLKLSGFFLNSRFQYQEGFEYNDSIRSGVTKVIERLAPNVTFAIEATREIAQFRGKIGRFGDLTAQTAIGIMNPGPTSFAPVIDAAVDIVEKSNGQYHVLVIIADGQVTRNPDTQPGTFSPQEHATIKSIVAASQFPLSIVLVGVGDGPWDSMKQFDDNIPYRAFDNFQFVDFTKIMAEKEESKKEAAFALAALMEIPYQYRATQNLNYLGRRKGKVPGPVPLPPPPEVIEHDNAVQAYPHTTSFQSDFAPAEQVCSICLTNQKDLAFGCGHQTCKDCGATLSLCPICRTPITIRVRLYSS